VTKLCSSSNDSGDEMKSLGDESRLSLKTIFLVVVVCVSKVFFFLPLVFPIFTIVQLECYHPADTWGFRK
jgi:hypothetical protein